MLHQDKIGLTERIRDSRFSSDNEMFFLRTATSIRGYKIGTGKLLTISKIKKFDFQTLETNLSHFDISSLFSEYHTLPERNQIKELIRKWTETKLSPIKKQSRPHDNTVDDFAISRNSRFLALLRGTRHIQIWDTFNGNLLHDFQAETPRSTKVQKTRYVEFLTNNPIHQDDVRHECLTHEGPLNEHASYPRLLSFSNNLNGGAFHLALAKNSTEISIWEITITDLLCQANSIAMIHLHKKLAWNTLLSQDGKFFFMCEQDGFGIHQWDIQRQGIIKEYKSKEFIKTFDLSTKYHVLLIGTSDGFIQGWNYITGQVVFEMKYLPVTSLNFANDDERFAIIFDQGHSAFMGEIYFDQDQVLKMRLLWGIPPHLVCQGLKINSTAFQQFSEDDQEMLKQLGAQIND